MDLEDLVRLLPSVGDYPLDPTPGIRRATAPPQTFVEPSLDVASNGAEDVGSASVVLISAPAAMGKTMLANAVAYEIGAPLWDLGEFPVGSGSFVGKIVESHGPATVSTVLTDITAGKYCVALDALDEGLTLARSDNFTAFLEDLATQIAKLGTGAPSVVAFGRTDTMELAELVMTDVGLPLVHLSIAYFDRNRANEFIEKQLDEKGHATHRQHPERFAAARDALFSRLQAAITLEADEELGPEAFLGYAPVLLALADYLEHDNYQVLLNEIETALAVDGAGVAAFLAGVVRGLLNREQSKLFDRLPEDTRVGIKEQGGGDQLFDADEQCHRLLARAMKASAPKINLPRDLLAEYEDRVIELLPEHPFVGSGDLGFASVVFRDYVLSHGLILGTADTAQMVRTEASRPSFRPSPLLATFVEQLLRTSERDALAADDLGLVYDSLKARDSAFDIAAALFSDSPDLIEFSAITQAGFTELVAAAPSGTPARLPRELANAAVFFSHHGLTLGTSDGEFILGPAAYVDVAGEVTLEAPVLRVLTREDFPAIIEAASFKSVAAEPRLSENGPHQLSLVVPEVTDYPWVTRITTLDRSSTPRDDELVPYLRELSKLMTWFRSNVAGDLSVRTRSLDVLVAKGRVSEALVDFALKKGLIVARGPNYVLEPNGFGINYQQVRARVLTEPVRQFLAEFAASQR